MNRITFTLFVCCLLPGCAAISPDATPINPPMMHKHVAPAFGSGASSSNPASESTIGAKSVAITSAKEAEALPVGLYYEAMTAARSATGTATSTAIQAYVDAGVTLVNSYCIRWFQTLSEQGVLKGYVDGNSNVIRQLGTALLGIGKASSYIVGTYGAANTAYAGLSQNFGESFLVAPNSRRVKAQVLNLLDQGEQALNGKTKGVPAPATFTEAYRRLERFADLCTHSTAKEIVNNALEQATASIAPDGKISLRPTDAALATASATYALEKRATEEKIKELASQAQLNKDTADKQAEAFKGLNRELNSLNMQLGKFQAELANERARRESVEQELLNLRKQQAPS